MSYDILCTHFQHWTTLVAHSGAVNNLSLVTSLWHLSQSSSCLRGNSTQLFFGWHFSLTVRGSSVAAYQQEALSIFHLWWQQPVREVRSHTFHMFWPYVIWSPTEFVPAGFQRHLLEFLWQHLLTKKHPF